MLLPLVAHKVPLKRLLFYTPKLMDITENKMDPSLSQTTNTPISTDPTAPIENSDQYRQTGESTSPVHDNVSQGDGPLASQESAPASTDMREMIIENIKTVYDPEVPVNIYELGLIYEVNLRGEGAVHILMTLTSPGCPAAGMLPGEVEEKARAVPGVTSVDVELTFDPPWEQGMMTEEARLELGFM